MKSIKTTAIFLMYILTKNIGAKATENLKASGVIKAEFKKFKADYEEYSFRVKEESVYPTFDWVGDYVCEMIYFGGVEQGLSSVFQGIGFYYKSFRCIF